MKVDHKIRIGIDFPIYIMLFGMMLIQIASPLKITALMSAGTWIIVFSSVMAFVISLVLYKWKVRSLISIVSLIFVVLLSILYSLEFSYRNLVAGFCFLEIPLFLSSYSLMKNPAVQRAIYKCFVILSVYYLFLSFSSLAHVYYTEYGSVYMPYLTLGYKNPNETAMHLFVCFIVLTSLFFRLKHIVAKCFIVADIVAVMVLLWLTLSRTGVLMSVALLISVFLFLKKSIPQVVRYIALTVPLAFLLGTLLLSEYFSTWEILGEAIDTGRDSIYAGVLENMNPFVFLIGDFNLRFQNLHNGFWCIFATIGIIGFISFLAFLNSRLYETQKNLSPENSIKVAFLGLLGIIIYTSTEAAYITTGSVFAASVVSVYLLCISKTEKPEVVKKVKVTENNEVVNKTEVTYNYGYTEKIEAFEKIDFTEKAKSNNCDSKKPKRRKCRKDR